MASSDPLHITFDDGFGSLGAVWNVDTSTPGEIRLGGLSAIMEWATGPEAGHGYGTYTIEAKVEGSEPGTAIVFWPGNDVWPGQEMDMAEITPDGSGRQYGTLHYNNNGSDGFHAEVYDGVANGVFHQYQMTWEPGRVTHKVDGEVKAVFTENVPVDFANGGVNNTIGFLNNNPDTALTVRDVKYAPLGGEVTYAPLSGDAPAWTPPAAEATAPDVASFAAPAVVADAAAEAFADVAPAAGGAIAVGERWDDADPFASWTDAAGNVDWETASAHVMTHYHATGNWFF